MVPPSWPAVAVRAGAATLAIGLVGFVGVVFDLPVLSLALPGFAPIRANTALALILLGAALVALALPAAPPAARVLRRAAAAVVLLLAALTIVEYASGMAVGIDRLLVRDPAARAGALSPGRIAPLTAVALVASATALLLLDTGRAVALAQGLALATGALGFVTLVGHAYRLHVMPLAIAETAMALPSAIAFLVVPVALLFARPDGGLMRVVLSETPAGVVVRRLVPVVFGGPLVLGWLAEAGRLVFGYGHELTMALFVVGTVVVFTVVVWSAALALQRTDLRRRRAENALVRAGAEVERATARTVELADANKALVETTARMRALERVNRLITSSLAFDEVLQAIARAAADIMATPVVSFWLVDERARTVTVRAWSDPAVSDGFTSRPRVFGEGPGGLVALRREPVHIPDVFAPGAPELAAPDWWRGHGLSSFYGVPVFSQDELLAVVALNGRAPFTFDDDDQELLASFVAQAAVAIRNAALFAEAEERHRAAVAAEKRYRELFERNLAGILRTTPDGRIVDCNDAMLRLLGYESRAALFAHRVPDLYVDPAERARLGLPLRAGDRRQVEMHWRRADGTPIALRSNLAASDEPGIGVVMDGIIVDITDAERVAVAERDAEALRAVAKLANAAAHEINNPLAVIVGHLDLLARRFAADADVVGRLEKARAGCLRIAEMIAHMGRITRLEQVQQSPGLPPILDLRRSADAAERSPDDAPPPS